jgi:hypothetical protein
MLYTIGPCRIDVPQERMQDPKDLEVDILATCPVGRLIVGLAANKIPPASV